MDPGCHAGGIEGRGTGRRQPGDEAGQNVASTGSRQIGRTTAFNHSVTIGRGYHGLRPFESHHGPRFRRTGTGAGKPVAGGVEQARKLAVMGCQHAGAGRSSGKKRIAIVSKAGQCVSIEHDAPTRGERQHGLFARRRTNTIAGPDEHGVLAGVRKHFSKIVVRHHHRFEGSGIDREGAARRHHRHQPSPYHERRACRQPGGASGGLAANDQRMTAVIFMTFLRRPGQTRLPQARRI